MTDTAVIAGAGFSAPANVPVTSALGSSFIEVPADSVTSPEVNDRITHHLLNFWQDVFGYVEESIPPTFEDHFTALDLAANYGHNLGPLYTPSRLRATRRISIHRVFDILDQYGHSGVIARICSMLAEGRGNSLISLNWVIGAENHLAGPENDGYRFDYCVDGFILGAGNALVHEGLPLIKLHGSSNWHYCDSCRQLTVGHPAGGKTALHFHTFIEPRDFQRLGDSDQIVEEIARRCHPGEPQCENCSSPLTGRVATFSYSKALDYFPFHASWNAALRH